MSFPYILALDQGTTSSRSILFDAAGRPVATAQEEFPQIFPRPGWVEHDPEAIWDSQRRTAEHVLRETKTSPNQIAAIGIANQRETIVLWERKTGAPLHNAIVWQCRRTADTCDALRADCLTEPIRERTGLVIDAYFSGTKIAWLLDHVPRARERAVRGEICCGTIDSWLLYKLTGRFATDPSNASRTLLYNIHNRQWDPFLLEKLRVPIEVLPEVVPTSHVCGTSCRLFDAGSEVPVAALVGDQQAALFGQAAFAAGDSKNTYGTGCFLLMNTGPEPIPSKHGLLTTIAWQLSNQTVYALEGSVFIAGAAIQWLRDRLGIVESAAESETLASSVPDNGGVYFVPAFVGLGAPHWDPYATGLITGLTRGTTRAHIARAALEAISFQSAEVLDCMRRDSGRDISSLRVDGGAAANNFLLQHQADTLGVPVLRGRTLETTALGAACLAGLAVGFWKDLDTLRALWQPDREFLPRTTPNQRGHALDAWRAAVAKARSPERR